MKLFLTSALILCSTLSAHAGIIDGIHWSLSPYIKKDFKATCYDKSEKLKLTLIDRRYDGMYEIQSYSTDLYLENLESGEVLKREKYVSGDPSLSSGSEPQSPLMTKFDGTDQVLVSYITNGSVVEVQMTCEYRWSTFLPGKNRAVRARGVIPNETYGSLTELHYH